jgi:predicted translin family RNA/ssDNA-binding protein
MHPSDSDLHFSPPRLATHTNQEYAEAEQYRAWRTEGRLPTKADIGIVNSVRQRRPSQHAE